jgi:hypothetical protein
MNNYDFPDVYGEQPMAPALDRSPRGFPDVFGVQPTAPSIPQTPQGYPGAYGPNDTGPGIPQTPQGYPTDYGIQPGGEPPTQMETNPFLWRLLESLRPSNPFDSMSLRPPGFHG